jgi:cytochrome c-type biogenesis protein CcmH/NrfG
VQIRLRLNAVDQLVAQLLETNPECVQNRHVLSILLLLTSVIHRRVYKEVDELQQVGSLLGASVETKEKISLLLARAAFEQHDYETAHEVLFSLMMVTLPRCGL